MRTLEFQLGELLLNLRRNGFLSAAALLTVMASLSAFGIFYLLNTNINAMIGREARKVTISAFLPKEGLDEPTLAEVRRKIEAIPHVRSVEYVSPEAAFERTRRMLGNDEVFEALEGDSRLPAKFAVQPDDPQAIEAVADDLKSISTIDSVDYKADVVSKINALVRDLYTAGWMALGILSLITSAIISSTVKLTLYARRREIRIMQLVGATNGFIRTPFILEGLVHGFGGAVLALGATWLLYQRVVIATAERNPWLKLVSLDELMPGFALGMLLVGSLFGVVSSGLSLRRWLREA